MMKENILEKCKEFLPTWISFSVDDFTFDPPKGFSSFSVGVHCKNEVVPKSVMYRKLDCKDNAILDFNIEKHVFVALGSLILQWGFIIMILIVESKYLLMAVVWW